jgi:hypothetical protein
VPYLNAVSPFPTSFHPGWAGEELRLPGMTPGLASSCPSVLTSLRTISRKAIKPVDAMSFFLPILALSALAGGPQCFLRYRKDYRMAMCHGMAGRFTLTGIDIAGLLMPHRLLTRNGAPSVTARHIVMPFHFGGPSLGNKA